MLVALSKIQTFVFSWTPLIYFLHVQCETPRPAPPAAGGPSLYPELVAGRVPPDGSYVGASSCNQYTDSLGSGQRVLSYSYYTPGDRSTGQFRVITEL